MTGFFHFYGVDMRGAEMSFAVSMPYDGLFSFLQPARVMW